MKSRTSHVMFWSRVFSVVLAVCLLVGSQPAATQGSYTIIDLGTLAGDASVAYSVNNSGQVVGLYVTDSNHGFRTAPNLNVTKTQAARASARATRS